MSADDETEEWRDAQLRVSVFGMEQYILVIFPLLGAFWTQFWVYPAILMIIVVMFWLKKLGIPMPAALRLIRMKLGGKYRPNIVVTRKRRKL